MKTETEPRQGLSRIVVPTLMMIGGFALFRAAPMGGPIILLPALGLSLMGFIRFIRVF